MKLAKGSLLTATQTYNCFVRLNFTVENDGHENYQPKLATYLNCISRGIVRRNFYGRIRYAPIVCRSFLFLFNLFSLQQETRQFLILLRISVFIIAMSLSLKGRDPHMKFY